MNMLLDAERIVLTDVEQRPPCGYKGCAERATMSTIWTCGETTCYCDRHLVWAENESKFPGIVCCCGPEGVSARKINIVMVVPL